MGPKDHIDIRISHAGSKAQSHAQEVEICRCRARDTMQGAVLVSARNQDWLPKFAAVAEAGEARPPLSPRELGLKAIDLRGLWLKSQGAECWERSCSRFVTTAWSPQLVNLAWDMRICFPLALSLSLS